MFINFTNHPFAAWSSAQLNAAKAYGEITDIAFPDIRPDITDQEMDALVSRYANQLIRLKPDAVLCQGEYTFAFSIVSILLERNVRVLAACSERVSTETTDESGTVFRKSQFVFRRFRDYRRAEMIPDDG